jgi:hypothetical protein
MRAGTVDFEWIDEDGRERALEGEEVATVEKKREGKHRGRKTPKQETKEQKNRSSDESTLTEG